MDNTDIMIIQFLFNVSDRKTLNIIPIDIDPYIFLNLMRYGVTNKSIASVRKSIKEEYYKRKEIIGKKDIRYDSSSYI